MSFNVKSVNSHADVLQDVRVVGSDHRFYLYKILTLYKLLEPKDFDRWEQEWWKRLELYYMIS